MSTFKDTATSDRSPSSELTLPIPSTENKEISDHLRARLEKVDALEGALQAMNDKYNSVLEDLGKVNSEVRALKQLDIKQEELVEQAQLLDKIKAELAYSTKLDQLRVSIAEQRVNDHIEMVKLIFRNPITRIKATVPVAVKGGDSLSGQYDKDGTPIISESPGWVSNETSTSEEEVT